jgi:hypothetical protein
MRAEPIKTGPSDPGRWSRLLSEAPPSEVEEAAPARDEESAGIPEPGRRPRPPAPEVDEVWAQVAVGRFADTLASASALSGLHGRWLEARCLHGLGRHGEAAQLLGDALEDADESDAIYPEALHLLATLQIAAGRYKAANRTARDLADSFPAWRAGEVAAMIRGLSTLR